jgi:hypothetical protein
MPMLAGDPAYGGSLKVRLGDQGYANISEYCSEVNRPNKM